MVRVLQKVLSAWFFAMSFVMPSQVLAQLEFVDDLQGLTEVEKAWLEGDGPIPDSTDHVNEGALKWLAFPAADNEYHLHNRMRINNGSLQDGWMSFEQCHYNIDPVGKIEIVYVPNSVRNLTVKSYTNIQQAVALQNSVAITMASKGAQICISGESKTLRQHEGKWIVRRGPYMRKFLDGYYPMQVTEQLDWSQTNLVFLTSSPKSTIGHKQVFIDQTLEARYRFEGSLMSEYQFKQAPEK